VSICGSTSEFSCDSLLSPVEELCSALVHAVGVLVAMSAFVLMVLAAGGEPLRVVTASVFGASLVFLYLTSTLYHLSVEPRTREALELLDHVAIFLLIAGSYTPLALVGLGGAWGWALFGTVWTAAVAGVVYKTGLHAPGRGAGQPVRARRRLHGTGSTAVYLAMGWLVVLVFDRVLEALSPGAVRLLVAGGLSYTGGLVFFAWKSLPFNHALWHLGVLGGSVCHVMATLDFLAPPD
jgi:hemolysin III